MLFMTKPLTVLLVGAPNVGKSTFFNRLTLKDKALVASLSGTTRDAKEGLFQPHGLSRKKADAGGCPIHVYDTPGVDADNVLFTKGDQEAPLYVSKLLKKADLLIWLVDGARELTGAELDLVPFLRQSKTPVWLVINKCDGGALKEGFDAPYRLGFQTFFHISALHGDGMHDIVGALQDFATKRKKPEPALSQPANPEADETTEETQGPLRIALVGRVNVGKSTLMNSLLGYERMQTGSKAHLTRDAIKEPFQIGTHDCLLWDTAGLAPKQASRRQKGKGVLKDDKKTTFAVDQAAQDETRRAIQFAHVVVLVVSADTLLERPDLMIAEHILREGRAVVVAVNKWDQVKDPAAFERNLRYDIDKAFFKAKGVMWVALSAKESKGLARLKKTILQAFALWNTKVPTAPLNTLLQQLQQRKAPPLEGGFRPRLKYITQTKTRPPTFCVFGTSLKRLPQSYEAYLLNAIRQQFNLKGVPLRLQLKTTKNPYQSTS